MGRSAEELCAEMLRVLGEQARSDSEGARLRLVDSDRSIPVTPDEES
jgi:hypothetical protein